MKQPLISENYRLRLPGPAPVPDRVSRAMTVPIVNHRGPEFRALMAGIQARLQPILGTENDVLLFASSGTGMMEASVLNAVAPGERILVLNNGQFCERFAEIARTFGFTVDTVDAAWGEVPALDEVEGALKSAAYRAVIAVHNESSTGSVAELAALGSLLRDRDTLLIVDSVSGLGGLEMRQDEWGVDIVVSASHKALMCPPGLGLASISDKAWHYVERENAAARFFWDFRKARANLETNETPFTPPVSLLFGLHEALHMIEEEGVVAVLERHRRLAAALRAGAAALGLTDFTRSRLISNTVVVLGMPEGLDGGEIVRALYNEYRTVVAGARNRLSGKVIRFGVMGDIGFETIETDMEQLAKVLADRGRAVEASKAFAAARQQYEGNMP